MNRDDPRMANVECGIARISYGHGQNGLEIAETIVTAGIWVLDDVRAARACDAATFPAYGPDDSAEHAARRIIASLLDAGWRPPDTDCLDLPDDFEDAQ